MLQFLSEEDGHCPPIRPCTPVTDVQFTPKCTSQVNVATLLTPRRSLAVRPRCAWATEPARRATAAFFGFAKTKSVLGLISLFDIGRYCG